MVGSKATWGAVMKNTRIHVNRLQLGCWEYLRSPLGCCIVETPYAKKWLMLFSLVILAALTSCGGGSSGFGANSGSQGSENQPSQDDSQVSGGEPQNLQPDVPAVVPGNPPINDEFPFSGTFVMDEFVPSVVSPDYLGVIEISPNPLSKRRVLDGSMPRQLADGRIVYRQPCGQRVHRIMIADQNLRLTQITPCSSEIPNGGASPTDFQQSVLSPDGTHVAVEARYFLNSSFNFATLIIDINSQETIATWDGAYAGTWMPDGRLLLASNEGLFVLDESFDNPTRLGDEITSAVNNPAVSPDGTSIAFEYNQQIWGMNIDGTGARQLLYGGARLRYPVWAPDGTATLAYLALPSRENYHSIIYVADLVNGQAYALNLDPVLEFPIDSLRTVKGPISWNQ